MKSIKNILFITSMFIVSSCVAVKINTTKAVTSQKTQTSKHEIFSYKEGYTTYIMQKYFLVILKKGGNRNQSDEEAQEIQKKHLEHINWLNKTGKISIAGPSEKQETIAGFLLFNTETLREADSLARLDPAVKSGRLDVETVPWWAAKGSILK